MLQRIKNQYAQIRFGLSNINSRPIGKTVLIIVLFLDLFILGSLFQGLSDHTSQLVSPDEYIPGYCRNIVIDEDWSESDRLIRIAELASAYRGRYTYTNGQDEVAIVHPVCTPISKLMLSIKNDKSLATKLSTFLRYRKSTNQFSSELERTRAAYDTSLLEDIAAQNAGERPVVAIKRQVTDLTGQLNNLAGEEAASRASLLQNEKVQELFNIIDASSNKNREILLEALRYANFWAPVKRLGMEMIFLLPLIAIFYFWNSKSLSANRPYQSLVSSHLLVVVFIPVLFKVLELVYEILPKKLLKEVFELLQSFNLVALWHYVLMGAGIAAALALIYVMQQKIFSQEKIVQKRIAKGQCQNCGVHVPGENNACSRCGFQQFRRCTTCDKSTFVYGKYCRECGASE